MFRILRLKLRGCRKFRLGPHNKKKSLLPPNPNPEPQTMAENWASSSSYKSFHNQKQFKRRATILKHLASVLGSWVLSSDFVNFPVPQLCCTMICSPQDILAAGPHEAQNPGRPKLELWPKTQTSKAKMLYEAKPLTETLHSAFIQRVVRLQVH